MARKGEYFVLLVIILFGLVIRVIGFNYDLPYIYHPDEPTNIRVIQRIFKGDLNPHFFNYPSLFFYINAVAYIPYYLYGKFTGSFHARIDIPEPISLTMGVTRIDDPFVVILSRLLTIVIGTIGILLVYLICKQFSHEPLVAIVSALFFALNPTAVSLSRFITPDSYATFFVLISIFGSYLVLNRGSISTYLLAGFGAGLAASTKYNAVFVLVSLLVAHFLRYGKSGLLNRNLYFAVIASGLGFFITTPFSLLDTQNFLKDFFFEMKHYSTGHPGMEGNTLTWYLTYMWQTAGISYVLAACGIFYSLVSSQKRNLVVISFVLVYFVVISRMMVRNDRTILPIIPLFMVMGSWMLIKVTNTIGYLTSKHERFPSKTRTILTSGFFLILLCLTLVQPITRVYRGIINLLMPNSRETARIWIEQNLPEGSRLAIESYSPFINPEKFLVQGVGQIIDHDLNWYYEQDFDYLVFSQGMYGRYFAEPQKYNEQVKKYQKFFDELPLVKIFRDGNYEIRIYKVKSE
jgi:4-amino-4-deoxy-L-arabinose transferase-like glycosyltransferase